MVQRGALYRIVLHAARSSSDSSGKPLPRRSGWPPSAASSSMDVLALQLVVGLDGGLSTLYGDTPPPAFRASPPSPACDAAAANCRAVCSTLAASGRAAVPSASLPEDAPFPGSSAASAGPAGSAAVRPSRASEGCAAGLPPASTSKSSQLPRKLAPRSSTAAGRSDSPAAAPRDRALLELLLLLDGRRECTPRDGLSRRCDAGSWELAFTSGQHSRSRKPSLSLKYADDERELAKHSRYPSTLVGHRTLGDEKIAVLLGLYCPFNAGTPAAPVLVPESTCGSCGSCSGLLHVKTEGVRFGSMAGVG